MSSLSIASIQRSYDESINVGDLYKIGSAIGICIERSPQPFVSDVEFDGPGTSVTAKFKILQPGKIHVWNELTLAPTADDYSSTDDGLGEEAVCGVIASAHSHLFKLSVGAFSVERPARAIEIGFRSNLSVRSSGITNFNSLVTRDDFEGNKVPDDSYQAYIDAEFCGGMEDGEDTDGDTYRKEILPGKYTASDTRYSFFKISYRPIDETNFIELDHVYGIRSATGVNVYNYLRLKFLDSKRREFRLMPVSAWEIRSGEAPGNLYVMDPHVESVFTVIDKGVEIQGNGEQVARNFETFMIKAFQNENSVQLGMGLEDDPENHNYVDGWARVA